MRTLVLIALSIFGYGDLACAQSTTSEGPILGRAFNTIPIALSNVGRSPLLTIPNNGFCTLVTQGVSTYTSPYFLLRRGMGGVVEVVFFNDDCKGGYIKGGKLVETEAEIVFVIDVRGGGEAGQWKTHMIFNLNLLKKSNSLSVKVKGEETFTRLFLFKTKSDWSAELLLSPATIDSKLLEKAQKMDSSYYLSYTPKL
jgi:hypothetical protein